MKSGPVNNHEVLQSCFIRLLSTLWVFLHKFNRCFHSDEVENWSRSSFSERLYPPHIHPVLIQFFKFCHFVISSRNPVSRCPLSFSLPLKAGLVVLFSA